MVDDILAVAVLYGTLPTEAPAVCSLGEGLERRGTRTDLLLYDNSPLLRPCQSTV